MRLAVLSSEFFDRSLGRMGGFGWATRKLANVFSDESLGVEVLFLSADRAHAGQASTVHGRPLIARMRQRYLPIEWLRLRNLGIDMILTIDYRESYAHFLRMLPRVPVVVWARDPKAPDDWERISTVRVPGHGDAQPRGLEYINTFGAANVFKDRKASGVSMHFAVTSPFLQAKVGPTYNVDVDDVSVLPNIIPLPPTPISKSTEPTIVFVGRIDAQKRPWIYFKLAERMPEYEFIVLGQSHFHGPGAWTPEVVPPNLKLMGHADGATKDQILREAWMLVNTSIHEGLAVSFLESLSYETPIVATVDPEGLASRFGAYAGEFTGDGFGATDILETSIRGLVTDEFRRRSLGREGRRWVETHHNREQFLSAFDSICNRCGVVRQPKDLATLQPMRTASSR